MKCKRCRKDVEDGWNFCSNCGRKLDRIGFKFPGFSFKRQNVSQEDDEFGRMERQMEQEIGKMFKMFGMAGMPNVKIKFGTMNNGPIQKEMDVFSPEKEIKKTTQKKVQRRIEKTEEPETKIKKIGPNIEIEVELPGVKSLKDVVLKIGEESLEIRAYAGTKMYFKLVPVPKNSRLIEKSFNKNALLLVLNK